MDPKQDDGMKGREIAILCDDVDQTYFVTPLQHCSPAPLSPAVT
jgi:hypothetical protein